jgi:pilus assembly protein Flp/PilA
MDTTMNKSIQAAGPAKRSVPMSALSAFFRNESGSTAVEYGLMAAGISAVVLAAVSTASTNLKATLDGIAIRLGPP